MKVRGAPAIAIVAVLALAVECDAWLSSGEFPAADIDALKRLLCQKLDYLGTSRPTAVNLFIAIDDIKSKINSGTFASREALLEAFIALAEAVFDDNASECALISRHGADYIKNLVKKDKVKVLTHCNTGSLATAKYGTALGVIRFLRDDGVLERVYNTETRPYNQGARLTSFELAFEKIPSTLVADSAVSFLMRSGNVDAVVVGADRICRNGDTANKIGTYQIAIAAKHHGIPFFIAAPFTSIDLNLASGDQIHIEERSSEELTHSAQTKKRIVTEGIDVWNPSFDVAPAELITGIITELGVIDEKDPKTGAFDIKTWLASKRSNNIA